MPWFRTFIRGKHFLLEHDGRIRAHGFYAARFVETDGTAAAELAAVALIRADLTLRTSLRNDISDPPQLFVDEIEEIDPLDVPPSNPGLVFFSEDENGLGAELPAARPAI